MDDDLLLLPLEPSDLADPEPATIYPQDGSGWWPVIAVVAVLIALFALIRDDSGPRVAESPDVVDAPITVPVTTEAVVTVPVTIEPEGVAFEPAAAGPAVELGAGRRRRRCRDVHRLERWRDPLGRPLRGGPAAGGLLR